MEPVQLLALGAGAMAAGAGVLAATKPKPEFELERFELRFPAGLSDGQVKAVLAGLSGMRRSSAVVLETVANKDRIRFFVSLEERDVPMFRGHLRGALPGARLDAAEPVDRDVVRVAKLDLSGADLLLAHGEQDEVSALLLGLLSELALDGSFTYRWRLTPAAPQIPPLSDKGQKHKLPPEQVKALRVKHQGTLLRAELSVEVAGESEARLLEVAQRVAGLLRPRVIRGRLDVQLGAGLDTVIKVVARRRSGVLSATELVGVIGWPVGSPELPLLELGTAPQLMVDQSIPAEGEGRRIGTSTWPGAQDRVLVQPPEGGLSHTLLLGPTGSGKSTAMVEMAVDDMRQNRGLVLIDMKGDGANDVLARVPKHRVGDIIVLDPAEGIAVPGLKVLGGNDPELIADQLLATFKGIFSDSWGVRSDQYLRLGFVTLTYDTEATLADLGFLFTNQAYRAKLVGRIDDPMLKAAWQSFEQLKPAEQAQHLASPLRKVNEVIARRIVRGVLAQVNPKFDMDEVLAKGRIVVVSLSPGRLGTPAASLIGALVVYETHKAVLARQSLSHQDRHAFSLYIDEPKVLTQGSPLPLDSAFELFRGMGVGITLAAQSVGQLGRELQRAAVSNAGTLVVFRQGRSDAELLARELPGVSAEALQHLPRFEAVARVSTGHGEVAKPATVKTPAPSEEVSYPAKVRKVSAERYGTDPDEIDRQIRHRHGLDGAAHQSSGVAEFGRTRKQS